MLSKARWTKTMFVCLPSESNRDSGSTKDENDGMNDGTKTDAKWADDVTFRTDGRTVTNEEVVDDDEDDDIDLATDGTTDGRSLPSIRSFLGIQFPQWFRCLTMFSTNCSQSLTNHI